MIRRIFALSPQSSHIPIRQSSLQTSSATFTIVIFRSPPSRPNLTSSTPATSHTGSTSRPHVTSLTFIRKYPLTPQYPQFTTEWAIPYEKTQACLRDLRNWLEQEHASSKGLRPHFPLEIRFSDADDIWLSPSFGQRTTWIGIIQYKYVIFITSLAWCHTSWNRLLIVDPLLCFV